jgi:hypothetical protein
MRTATTKEKIEFAFLMARHSSATIHDLQRIMRYGSSIGRIAEDQCNRGLTPEEELKLLRLLKKVSTICKSFGAVAVFQNDPRGCTVKIQVPDGYTNDWGREGICVPTS